MKMNFRIFGLVFSSIAIMQLFGCASPEVLKALEAADMKEEALQKVVRTEEGMPADLRDLKTPRPFTTAKSYALKKLREFPSMTDEAYAYANDVALWDDEVNAKHGGKGGLHYRDIRKLAVEGDGKISGIFTPKEKQVELYLKKIGTPPALGGPDASDGGLKLAITSMMYSYTPGSSNLFTLSGVGTAFLLDDARIKAAQRITKRIYQSYKPKVMYKMTQDDLLKIESTQGTTWDEKAKNYCAYKMMGLLTAEAKKMGFSIDGNPTIRKVDSLNETILDVLVSKDDADPVLNCHKGGGCRLSVLISTPNNSVLLVDRNKGIWESTVDFGFWNPEGEAKKKQESALIQKAKKHFIDEDPINELVERDYFPIAELLVAKKLYSAIARNNPRITVLICNTIGYDDCIIDSKGTHYFRVIVKRPAGGAQASKSAKM